MLSHILFMFNKQYLLSKDNVFITRRMCKISWPLSINMLTFYLLTITDSIFIGQYDLHGLDILNTVMMPFIALNQIVDYMHMGTVIPASQAFGEQNYIKAQRYVETGFFVYGVVGILFWLFWTLCAKNVYQIVTPDQNTQNIAVQYMSVVAYTYLVQSFGYKGIQAIFSTLGTTKYLLISGCIQVIVNIFANRVLIYGDFFFPELGVVGAAWGTLVSSMIGLLVLFYYLLRQKTLIPTFKGIFKLEKAYIWTTLRMGFPVGFDMVLWGFGGLFLIWMINHTDPSLNRFMFFFITLPEFSFRLYSGYILAVTNLVGRAYGAKNWTKVFKIMRFGLLETLGISIVISLFYITFPTQIAHIFTQDIDTIKSLQHFIPVMCLIMIPRTVWEIFNGTLHGLGVTVWGIFVQIVGLGFIVMQAYVYIGKMQWGILGICLIYTIDEILRVLFMGGRLWYESRKRKILDDTIIIS